MVNLAFGFRAGARVCAATVAACIVAAPAGADATPPEFAPPRMTPPPGEALDCYARLDAAEKGPIGVDVHFVVTNSGNLRRIRPVLAPEWVSDMAKCALRKATFQAGVRHGIPVDQEATVMLSIERLEDGVGDTLRVARIGPLVTVPLLIRRPGDATHCYPVGAGIKGEGAEVPVNFKVDADGRPVEMQLPSGTEPWAAAAITCALPRLAFYPATRGGMPVAAPAVATIMFPGPDEDVPAARRVTQPALDADGPDLDSVRAACLPKDGGVTGVVFTAFTIGENGAALAPVIFGESGNPRLDEAAKCILGKVRFTPLRIGSRRHDDVVTWALAVAGPAGN